MRTFAINTLGCKVNQYESQQIRELLESLGLAPAEIPHQPDLTVINTCCVTSCASAKSRQTIRRAQKQNPAGVIAVCGCLAVADTGELSNSDGKIRLIENREAIAPLLHQIIGGSAACVSNSQSYESFKKTIKAQNKDKIKPKNELEGLPCLKSFKGHTRAFLKVQDGCDGYCSYCIIPKTRPVVRSRPFDTVLKEAANLVKSGHKEIVVTGIFLGAYGQDTVRRKNWNGQQGQLCDLLDKLAQIPNLGRIRLSSLEPGDVTEALLDTFRKHPNVMPHLHLSLQSGSNAILKRMCRQYDADEFLEKIDLIKSRLDRPAITCDIIVGFPGETDEDFQATVDLAKEVGFAKMHVFAFSVRKGTAAAKMKGKTPCKIIKQRSQILRDLDIESGSKFRRQFIGETEEVLLENTNGRISGRCERYFTVYLEKPDVNLRQNELVKVKLTNNSADGAIGKLVT